MTKKTNKDNGYFLLNVKDTTEFVCNTKNIIYGKCRICKKDRLKYVYVLHESETLHTTIVCRKCAEKLLDDNITPINIEHALDKRSKRRNDFINSRWIYNPEKNTYLKKYKDNYIVIKKGIYENWCVIFKNQFYWKYNGRSMQTLNEAQTAAFYIFEESSNTLFL